MANLYTKTGDQGETSLVGGSRVSKTDLRVECYGTVDEMGSALGFAKSLSQIQYVQETIASIQQHLFILAAEIASDSNGIEKLDHLIDETDISFLESVVDHCTEVSGPQKGFVVPGETPVSGALHLSRTIVRRAERNLLRLSTQDSVRSVLLKYLNRLSDAVYALARLEETWKQQEALVLKVEEEVRRQLGISTSRPPLTLKTCQKMAARAVKKAQELGAVIVFAAVDDGGNTILLQRMDDAFLGSIDIALNKAYTANAFKMSTQELGKFHADAALEGLKNSNHGRIILFGGGIPYDSQGRVIGAIGVSGGTPDQDTAIVQYALGISCQEEQEDEC